MAILVVSLTKFLAKLLMDVSLSYETDNLHRQMISQLISEVSHVFTFGNRFRYLAQFQSFHTHRSAAEHFWQILFLQD